VEQAIERVPPVGIPINFSNWKKNTSMGKHKWENFSRRN